MRRVDLRGESGQSLVSTLLILPMVLYLAGITAIVGQAVSRKVALQIVADAGAFTGASVQATGYNQLSQLNSALQAAWLLFTAPPLPGLPTGSPLYPAFKAQQAGEALPLLPSSVLTYVPMVECNVADSWIGSYRAARALIGAAYDVTNVGFAIRARQEARRLSELNARDLFPGERLAFAEYATTPTELSETGGIAPFVARNPGVLAHTPQVRNGTPLQASFLGDLPLSVRRGYLVPATRTLRYACVTIRPRRISRRVTTNLYFYRYERTPLSVWRAKMPRPSPGGEPQPVDSFVWLATAPAIRVPIFGRLLDLDLIPRMRAAAVAKPVGGSIAAGIRRYVAKLVPVASVMLGHDQARRLPGWSRNFDSVLSRVGIIYDQEQQRARLVAH